MQQRIAIRICGTSETWHDQHIPLEPLGAVQRQNFHCTGRRWRTRVQGCGEVIEGVAGQPLGVALLAQGLQERLRIRQIALLHTGGRAAEPQPGMIDTLPQRQATLRTCQHRHQRSTHARQARARLRFQPQRVCFTAHKLQHRFRLVLTQLLQLA